MSGVFDAYAHYYDLLYRDKDYAGESEYVAAHIRKHVPRAQRILELGCGTGTHAEYLARMGYAVHGVDISDTMLTRAEARKQALPPDIAARLSFGHGDVRTVRTGNTYDAVLSLFHVMSYQTTNEDLQAAFATAKTHLAPGGLFLFDCWYGPAVLSDLPSVRSKHLEDDEIEVERIAEPVMHFNDNLVDVHYTVNIHSRDTGQRDEVCETHRMRYLFLPEIRLLAGQYGFEVVKASEWLSEREVGKDTWYVCVSLIYRGLSEGSVREA